MCDKYIGTDFSSLKNSETIELLWVQLKQSSDAPFGCNNEI